MENETNLNIKNIYSLLKSKGIDKKFIREVLLPSWWDENIPSSKAGLYQTISLISKNLGTDLSDLISNKNDIQLSSNFGIKFKQNKSYKNLVTDFYPQSLASRLYNLVEKTYSTEFSLKVRTSDELRELLLKSYSEINLNNLLEFLWNNGIPVIYVSEYPKDINKLDGMIFRFGNRPVIVISSKRKHDAWLIFILAHELGHLFLNHLNKTGNIIFDSDLEIPDNNEEADANNFAINFLIKDINNIPDINSVSTFKLINILKPESQKFKIDAGVLSLMYAFKSNNFPSVSRALNSMYSGANASVKVIEFMKRNLALENLGEEDLDYFQNITGLAEE